jgi:hypothetical protein
MLAVFAAYSQAGSERLAAGEPPRAATPVVLAGQTAQNDAETRRLADAVRALATDRERLLARISALEHSVEDITGSIKRQTPPTAPAANAAPAAPAPPTPTAAVTLPRGDSAAAPAVPIPPAEQTAAPPQAAAHREDKLTSVAPAAAPAEEEPPAAPKTEIGADVGGATNFNGLRVLWNSLKGSNGGLLEGLHPLVSVKETPGRSAELRLIVGPIADPDAASRFCVTLSVNRRYCQPTNFEGQPFQVGDTAPPPARKPAQQPPPQERRGPAPGPASAARPPQRSF